MRLFIIRHGQTTNNVLMAEIYARRDRGEITPQEAEEEWLAKRVDDPAITETGIEEAKQLGIFYGEVFKATGSKLRIMPSPFYRTCQTCQPLAQALGQQARVVVNPDIYENGGVYIAGQDADGNAVRDGPGECMSAADIREKFPGYETDMLPQEGPWYTDGFETEAMSSARAERVAAWLKSPELQEEVGDEVLTLVMHGGFIDILVKAILGLRVDHLGLGQEPAIKMFGGRL